MSLPSSPVVKRAAVTYGRRKESPSDADTSTSTLRTTLSSRASSCSLRSSGFDEDVPPSSDECDALDSSIVLPTRDNGDDSDGENTGTPFVFSWRKDLEKFNSIYAERPIALDSRDALRDDIMQSGSQAVFGGDTRVASESHTPDHTTSPSPSPAVARHRRRLRNLPIQLNSDIALATSQQVAPRLAASSSPSSSTRRVSPAALVAGVKGKGKQRSEGVFVGSDEEQFGGGEHKRNTRRRAFNANGKHTKAPTRKEREETQKATARMVAERVVSMPHSKTKQIGLTQLFEKIGRGISPADDPPLLSSEGPASDPIQPFSSSPTEHAKRKIKTRVPSPLSPQPTSSGSPILQATSDFVPTGLLGPDSPKAILLRESSDEELPDVGALLENDAKERQEETMRKQLAEVKRRALENTKSGAYISDQDDSDLEVVHEDMQTVAKDEARARKVRSAQGFKRSVGKSKQLALAGPIHKLVGKSIKSEVKFLKDAAAPTFGRLTKDIADHTSALVSKDDLNRFLLNSAGKQAEEATRLKEEEWVRRGGKIRAGPSNLRSDGEAKRIFLTVVSKGIAVGEDDREQEDEAEGEDEDDPDYQDGHERTALESATEDSDNVFGQSTHEDNQNASNSQLDHLDADDEEQTSVFLPSKSACFSAVISDEEDGILVSRSKAVFPDSLSVISSALDYGRNRRVYASSSGDQTEDGTDKENDIRLMYDRGEDKENTAVAAQPLLGHQTSSGGSFALRGVAFLADGDFNDSLLIESTPLEDRRPPLKELRRDDSDGDGPFAPIAKSPARRLVFSPTMGPPARRLSPDLQGGRESEDVDQDSSAVNVPTTLKPGFAEFFASENVSGSSSLVPNVPQNGGLSQFFTQQTVDETHSLTTRKSDQELSLTLDVGLQPTLEVSQTLLRKADNIFEKEQGYLAENFDVNSNDKSQFYVNEHGFLTQSVPSARILQASHTSSSPLMASILQSARKRTHVGSVSRKPLAPIDSDIEMETPNEQPRRLLKRRRTPPEPTNLDNSRHSSPSPSPTKHRNAFDVLKQAAHAPTESDRKLQKSEFIEGEAEESDDDAMIGFGGRRKEDDESDDESQDATLAELVDDAAMDDKTLGADAVLEKAREHWEEDDQLREKYARDAADGKLRARRRNHGLGFEDSESDDEDEDAKWRRQKMLKKRKIEGDTLEELAKNPSTAAFVEAYHADMLDDDDFVHLQQGELTLVDEHDPDAEEGSEPEVVSAAALIEELRKVAKEGTPECFNPHDTSWMEANAEGSDDEALPIKEIYAVTKPTRRPADWDPDMQSKRQGGEDDRDRVRMQLWAKSESRTSGGTSRSTGVSAVTARGRGKTAGLRTAKGQRPGSSDSAMKLPCKLTKSASALSAVSTSRRSKFQASS
ncbi:uncharacterized protein FIBRA_06996 [Fibroporia radiculosa]|uniref:DNA replication checkpoint mediator MRC1 domain-containing protein n=1 Tax=Fibroporia radiculosa TaxID=599839 RepID=J4GD43_9APHY|nr:uncharacterized protein FIBRA_06996 [Fibroporia radiculosa]CCM04803.1 predicted protein [Fibroporia radiculosa]